MLAASVMDELHTLILKHMELGGISERVLRDLREELKGVLHGAEHSLLCQIFRFVRDGELTVSVSSLGGQLCTVLASSSTTVRKIKQDVEAQVGIPSRGQCLIHESEILDDAANLGARVTPLNPVLRLVRLQASKLCVVGGSDEAHDAVAHVEVLDPALCKWISLPPLPKCRKHCAAVYLEGRVCVLGGEDENELVLDSAEFFDPDRGAWTILPSMCTRRAAFAATVWTEKLYVVGGHNDDDQVIPTIEVFDPAMRVEPSAASLLKALSPLVGWSALSPMPVGRKHLGVVIMDGTMYALGGSDDTNQVCARVDGFDLVTHVWQSLPPMAQARAGFVAGPVGSKICVAGGFDDNHALSSCEVFDTMLSVWFSLPSMGKARAALAGATLGDRLYVFGGHNEIGVELASAEALDLETGTWMPLPSMAFRRRSAAASVTS